jgi:hypothetical protein
VDSHPHNVDECSPLSFEALVIFLTFKAISGVNPVAPVVIVGFGESYLPT